MSTSTRPTRNPFPDQGAFSIEGRRRGPHGEPLIDATLVLPVETQARRLVAVYLERFGLADGPRGQAIGIRGEHGLGKTHAIGFLMRQIAEEHVKRGPYVRDVMQLYVKAGDHDLVELYRRLMRQIGLDKLRELTLRFTASVAEGSLMSDRARAKAAVKLGIEPELVYGMFDTSFVDEAAVRKRRDVEVDEATDGARAFQRALRYLDSELEDIAFRWLTGIEIDPDEAIEIGVAGPITLAETARAGLQVLAALCSRARTALIVYLDQHEKLVLDTEGKPLPDNIAILHTLVEVLPREDAMILIAGNEAAWEKLPADLHQRFGYNLLRARGLDLEEAKALVHLYLHPAEEKAVQRNIPAAELEPCTIDAITKAHLLSGGNARRLLQLLSEGYKRIGADGGLIDAAVIEVAAKDGGTPLRAPAELLEEIARLGARQGFAGVEGPSCSLRLSMDGSVRLLVMIGQAEHYYDEILNARDRFDEIELLHRSEPGARAVLVVLGYDSPEVREALERAGVEVLAYRHEDFDQEVTTILGDVRAADGGDRSELASQLSEVSRRLDELLAQREADVQGLEAGSADLLRAVDEEDVARRWAQAAGEWTEESRRQAGLIREARETRAADELAELERLREHAERERREAVRIVLIAVALFGAFTVTTLSNVDSGASTLLFTVWAATGLLLGLGAGGWIMSQLLRDGTWGLRRYALRPRAVRELSAPIGSLEELGPLAHGITGAAPLRFLLGHENPQVRYVAAVAGRPEQMPMLSRALPGERAAVVRRAFAQRLGREPDAAIAAYENACDAATRESVYVLDGMLRERLELPGEARRHTHRVLLALKQEPELTPATRVLISQPDWADAVEDAGGPTILDAAFRAGLPLSHRKTLRRLPIETLRDGTRTVSPFEGDGLGTFDHLTDKVAIETAYLQLSRVLFLSELGLLVDPAA